MRVIDQGQYQTLWISGNLKEVTKDLKDNFLQIRQNIVIQRYYGKDLGGYRIQMKDGKIFEVGRTFQKDFWGVGR